MADNTGFFNLNRGIYLDLDTLFDTRYGLIKQIDKTILIDMIKDESYFFRIYDEFKYINNVLFNFLYLRRDKTTLQQSPVTKVIEAIAAELMLLDDKKLQSGEMKITIVDINVYPYTLNEVEEKRIRNILNLLLLNNNIDIRFINIDPKDLTLGHVNERYTTMFIYDGLKWLDYHMAIKDGVATSTKLFIPSLFTYPVLLKNKKEIEDMLNAYSEVLKLFIDTTFLSSDMFSARSQYKEKLLNQLQED